MEEFRVRHEFSSTTSVSLVTRYVKAARCLLEEVIDMGGREVDLCNDVLIQQLFPGRRRPGFGLSSEIKSELCNSGFMSLPENHELHIKITKLLSLLQQVSQYNLEDNYYGSNLFPLWLHLYKSNDIIYLKINKTV